MSLEQKPDLIEIVEEKPGLRLITQNLLASAALFQDPFVKMDLVALEDLCNIIDAFSLCDQICLLSHEDVNQLPWSTDFFSALRDAGFITSINPPSEKIKTIIQLATKRLGTALNIGDTDMFINLFEHAWLDPEFHSYSLYPHPDRPRDYEAGELWLRSAPKVKDLVEELRKERDYTRETTFVARTFLYLACAEEYELALRPDIVRYPVLAKVAAMEGQFRSRLVNTLKERYADFVPYGNQELRQIVSPCAAIVFQRAGQDKGNIPREMMKLRKELDSTRKNLHKLEGEIFDPSADKGRAASENWDGIMKELTESFLSKSTFRTARLGEKVKRFRRLLNVIPLKDIGTVSTNPADVGAWIQLLVGLVDLSSEQAVQLLARGPIMDLYRILTPRQLANPAQLNNLVVPLFGEQVLRKTVDR